MLSQLLVTDLNRAFGAGPLGRQPQIHQEADRATVVTDQIAQQDVRHVIVEGCHCYTSR